MKRFAVPCLLPLLLGACESQSSIGMAEATQMLLAGSWPFEVAGHSSDNAQVWSGRGVSQGASSTFQFTIDPGNILCNGEGGSVAGDGNAFRNRIRCQDGRTADFTIRRPYALAKIWVGESTFSDGTRFSWEESSAAGALEPRLAAFRQAQAMARVAPPAVAPTKPVAADSVPARPAARANFSFPRAPERPDDIAVIIGNGDYGRLGKDIPDVRPAHADALAMRHYAETALGIRSGNIIVLKDATSAQMVRVFGSNEDHRGQLFDWVKPGLSRVFVYYAGHGAPSMKAGTPYLVPVDADAARIELNGYPLSLLYANLGKLAAERVQVVLEACFSGLSQAGPVLGKASPVYIEVKAPPVPPALTVIAASAPSQLASWEPDESHGLFTRHFLEGMAGKADFDKNGAIGLDELDRHLKATLTYWARRHYGRDQEAQIVGGRK